MKLLFILIIGLCAFTQIASAQSPYCGLTYYYDNAGNRIQRSVSDDCPTGPGGGGGSGKKGADDVTTIDSTAQNITEALFPNPTNGAVSVVFNTAVAEAQVIIADNLGNKLYVATTGGSSIPLDLSKYAPGIYFITVKVGKDQFAHKVVRE